jgi:cytochrome P450
MARRERRYGPVFRTRLFGRPTVVLLGPAANRFVLQAGMSHLSWRDGWPSNFHELLGNALFLQDGEEHRRKRNLLMPAFQMHAIAGYLAAMVPLLVRNLERWERLGRFAWYAEFRRLTFEVASLLFLGSELDPDSPEAEELTRQMDAWLTGLFAWPIRLPWTAYGRALKARKKLLEFVERAVEERSKGSSRPTRDALGLLVSSRGPDGERLSLAELQSQALLLIAAGHGTTTSMLTSLVAVLSAHPEIYERARAEQESLDLGDLGSPLTLEQIQRMTYLEQVLREVERCHPPAGFGFRGVVETFEFGGYTIPRGWQVLYSVEATHLDPRVFPEPERFDPGRCPHGRAEAERRSRGELVGFGGGPRICLGMTLAKAQIKMIASYLLRGYEWELEPGQDLRVETVPLRHPRDGLRVRFWRRAARASESITAEGDAAPGLAHSPAAASPPRPATGCPPATRQRDHRGPSGR